MPRVRDNAEQERLDRIGRHIEQLAEASAALKLELQIARQLAAQRAHAVKPHTSSGAQAKGRKKTR